MTDELLTIGSVVQIEGTNLLFMIMGYLPVTASKPGYVWDYSAVPFPMGFTSGGDVTCFDHDQITIVYAHGYKDIEEEIFASKMSELKSRTEESLKNTEPNADETAKEDE